MFRSAPATLPVSFVPYVVKANLFRTEGRVLGKRNISMVVMQFTHATNALNAARGHLNWHNIGLGEYPLQTVNL